MMLAAFGKVSGIIFGGALTVLVAFLLGRLLQRLFHEKLQNLTLAETRLFAFAIGAACLSNLIFLLSVARLVYDASLLALVALILVLWWRYRPPAQKQIDFAIGEKHTQVWTGILVCFAISYGILYLAHTLAPETRSDGVGYHLGLVRRYHNEHGFVPITTSFYAALSQGAEMLYLFAYSFGRGSAAKLVHFAFFLSTLAAMLAFARRYGAWRAGLVAVILFACSPIVVPDATSTYNDCALAFYQFMLFYGLLLWWQDCHSVSAASLGLLAGFCFALKYTGVVALLALLPVLCWKIFRDSTRWAEVLRPIAIATAAAAFVAAPWLIKNAVWIGDPVAPFYNSIFPNPYFTQSWEQGYRAYFRTYSNAVEKPPWWSYPLNLTVSSNRLGGLIGPIFLFVPFALLAWKKPGGKALLASAAVSFLPWFANAGTRFLIPPLVFVSLAMGLALFSLPARWATSLGCVALLAHAISSWPAVLPHWAGGVWSVVGVPWQAALRLEPEREYLLRNVPFYHTAEVISAQVSPPGRVFSLEPLPEAYFDAELMVSYQGALNQELFDFLATAVDEDLWPSRQRSLSWQPQPLRGFRVVETNAHEGRWRMSEIRFRDKRGIVSAGQRWQASAEPRPWDARRVIDGKLLPGWQSWEDQRPGMWIEVRFPEPLLLSGADAIYPWGQHFAEFKYFGLSASGEWQPLDVRSEQTRLPFHPEGLKKWAVAELARNRVKLLITNTEGGGHNFLAPKIADDPAQWGLREIDRDGPLRIYRILEPQQTTDVGLELIER